MLQKLLKKTVSKTTEVTVKFIGNKIADNIVKPKPIFDAKPEKTQEVLNDLRLI